MHDLINNTLLYIEEHNLLTHNQINRAKQIINEDDIVLLTHSKNAVSFSVGDGEEEVGFSLVADEENIYPFSVKNKPIDWNEYSYAGLLALQENSNWTDENQPGKKYTRAGMIQRVMQERMDKAMDADYKVELADNIYGEHILYNEFGVKYHITLQDFEKQTGYIDNVDWRTNKLGTTKHIMYLFNYFNVHPRIFKRLKTDYPFVEITLDPFNDYQVTWFYPQSLSPEIKKILDQYFGDSTFIPDQELGKILGLLRDVRSVDSIIVRPEVLEKVEIFFNKNLVADLQKDYVADYSLIKTDLYSYQKEGVEFALFKTGAIIADDMGLGKTVQAIAIAVFKREIFDFERMLIVCPASIKHQWKSEIEKFSDLKAVVVEGFPEERKQIYFDTKPHFYIVNYETVLRDLDVINAAGFDFVILDEAQKIKNYTTKTANAIKAIDRKHALIITGTPIENKLIDLYSLVHFIDPYFLTPLWEFSYQHCIFDSRSKNRIQGYYNLSELKQRMNIFLIRREKRKVLKQLPNVIQEDVFVYLHPKQASMHINFARGVASILAKKFKTLYDWQKLMLLLSNMRMVCDSTFLIDKSSHHSSKMVELKHILLEKLDMKNSTRKIIIFSEWITMLNIIGEMLEDIGLGYVKLTGKVPVKKRGKLIETFENDDDCRIFLSTESGGAGLNLQVADTVINFELPWNPAKKNQRIGRIDRLGQSNDFLTVLNLISVGSIEQRIASGILLKQNLFEGVLNNDVSIDEVDFSEKGRSQFIKQLEDIIEGMDDSEIQQEEIIPDQELIDDKDENEIHEDDHLKEPVQIVEEDAVEREEEIIVPDGFDEQTIEEEKAVKPVSEKEKHEKMEQVEAVLNKGMEFLSGIYQMSTGNELGGSEGQKIEIDKETGEVVMRFKMKF